MIDHQAAAIALVLSVSITMMIAVWLDNDLEDNDP
jgi:hypothetical protein